MSSTAWPVTIALIVSWLRSHIAAAIATVSKLKYRDLQIDYGREVKKLEEQAKVIDVTPQQALPAPRAERTATDILADADRLAGDVPEAAVTLAWTAVEDGLLQAVMRRACTLDPPSSNSARKNADLLLDDRAIDRAIVDLINRMRNLRNTAVRGGMSVSVSSNEAREFAALARGVVEKLASGRR